LLLGSRSGSHAQAVMAELHGPDPGCGDCVMITLDDEAKAHEVLAEHGDH
jgi:hypothetical protein